MTEHQLPQSIKDLYGTACRNLEIDPKELAAVDFPADKKEIIENAYARVKQDSSKGPEIQEEMRNYRAMLRIGYGLAEGMSKKSYDRVVEFADKKVQQIKEQKEAEDKKVAEAKKQQEERMEQLNKVKATLTSTFQKIGLTQEVESLQYLKDLNGKINFSQIFNTFNINRDRCMQSLKAQLQNGTISYDDYNIYGNFVEELFGKRNKEERIMDPETGKIEVKKDERTTKDIILDFGKTLASSKKAPAEPTPQPEPEHQQPEPEQSESKIIKKIKESKLGKTVQKFATWVKKTPIGKFLSISDAEWDKYHRNFVSNQQLEQYATQGQAPGYVERASVEDLEAMLNRDRKYRKDADARSQMANKIYGSFHQNQQPVQPQQAPVEQAPQRSGRSR